MKLKIEKLPTGKVKVELATAANRKPIVVELDRAQLRMLVELLGTAGRADKFTFQLEL